MARSAIKLTRDQREAIYQAVRTHLVGLSDVFTLLERQDDVPAAEKLAREFADDFRLLEDIGFVCKFDKRPYRRCSSPKRYPVKIGRHVFKVRAIGVTGLRGPAASAVIRITKPCSFGGHQFAARPKTCGSTVDK
jgi:hypothetical protein